MAASTLLGTPFIYPYTRKIFPGEQKVVRWHLDSLPILTNPATTEQHSLSSAELSKNKCSHHNVAVRIARQVTLEAFAKTRVMVSSPIIGLFYMKPAHPGNQYQHLQVTPGTVEPAPSREFYFLVNNLHKKPVHAPKGMLVAHCTGLRFHIIDLPQPVRD